MFISLHLSKFYVSHVVMNKYTCFDTILYNLQKWHRSVHHRTILPSSPSLFFTLHVSIFYILEEEMKREYLFIVGKHFLFLLQSSFTRQDNNGTSHSYECRNETILDNHNSILFPHSCNLFNATIPWTENMCIVRNYEWRVHSAYSVFSVVRTENHWSHWASDFRASYIKHTIMAEWDTKSLSDLAGKWLKYKLISWSTHICTALLAVSIDHKN